MASEIYAIWRSRRDRNRGFVLVAVGAIFFMVTFIYFNIVTFIISIGLFLFSSEYFRISGIWNLGAQGERLVAEHLKGLESPYIVLNDVKLPGVHGNIDHVVLGKNGIFAIETKNHKGLIRCNGDEWVQEKVGLRGTRYVGVLRNPSRQVKRNAFLLKKFIEEHANTAVYVNPIIVFTNKEAVLELNNPTIPVLRPEGLCHFIKKQEANIKFYLEWLRKLEGLIDLQRQVNK